MASRRDGRSASLVVASFPRADRTTAAAAAASSAAAAARRSSAVGSEVLLRQVMPVARRVCGDNDDLTLKMRWIYARTLYEPDVATLGDIREAVSTLEDAGRIARRVLGGAHPLTVGIEGALRNVRATLRARENL